MADDDPAKAKDIEARARAEFIEDKITAGNGKILGRRWAEDGKTAIWKVKWDSGDVEEIRHAVKKQ